VKFIVELRTGKSSTTKNYPYVRLAQDNWDDYGYKTTFYATLFLAKGDEVDLGTVKIMHEAQTGGYTDLPREPFEQLGPAFCSLGGELDYYEKLFKLGRSTYHAYLRGLSDAAYSDDVRAKFEDLEGYKVSLLRFSGAERTIADVHKLFSATKVRKSGSGFQVKLKTRVASGANSFTINFDFRRKGGLPHRINAVIGYNGTGKTRLLSNLAIVASGYGYTNKEDASAKTAGRFVDTPPPFKKVVVISYSAFDTFVIPGRTDIEKERLREEGDLFGYVYCGLRERGEDVEGDFDRRATYRLRTPKETESEFLEALRRVREAERDDTLLAILRPLLLDASFQRIGLTKLYADRDDSRLIELFRGLSSGHKIVLKIVTELTAHLDGDEPTLVLVDEPETHLHPPLLAALLKSIRTCLERLDGYAVIATHSPVVLQETPARFVNVLKRVSDRTHVAAPSIETFGESIGVITQEVFNLDDSATDWHDTLRDLADKRSLEAVEALFGRQLGFAARSYVVSVQNDDEG
jgi:ABC-type transport system involved in cytochrome c biogenesis ATPase subunit